jgi:hypothetical protein
MLAELLWWNQLEVLQKSNGGSSPKPTRSFLATSGQLCRRFLKSDPVGIRES